MCQASTVLKLFHCIVSLYFLDVLLYVPVCVNASVLLRIECITQLALLDVCVRINTPQLNSAQCCLFVWTVLSVCVHSVVCLIPATINTTFTHVSTMMPALQQSMCILTCCIYFDEGLSIVVETSVEVSLCLLQSEVKKQWWQRQTVSFQLYQVYYMHLML